MSCVRSTAIAVVLMVALALCPARQALAAEPMYFAETGHAIAEPFASAFVSLGGLDRFGFPRSDGIVENGRLVQYFQRAVLESHPEHAGTAYAVQLRLLGDLSTQGERTGSAWSPVGRAGFGGRYFIETRHSIAPQFLSYFDNRGGLDSFGYPISEAFESGGIIVQYTQRARLELHPANPAAYHIQLGLLGDEYIARNWAVDDARLRTGRSMVAASGASYEWGRGSIKLDESSQIGRYNAGIAVERLNGVVVGPGDTLDFDEVAKSWDGREDPVYLESRGTSCEGGLVAMRGGGVCYVSTAIWRAWMEAGLQTELRVSHSGLLDDFGAGYDAANTLVVRNDSEATIVLRVGWAGSSIVATVEADRPADRISTISQPERVGSQDFTIRQEVHWLDGRRRTEVFRSHYCW